MPNTRRITLLLELELTANLYLVPDHCAMIVYMVSALNGALRALPEHVLENYTLDNTEPVNSQADYDHFIRCVKDTC